MNEFLWLFIRALVVYICVFGMVAFTRNHIVPLFRREGGKVIPMRRSRSRGYTLIELMMVIATTAVVVSLIVMVVALVTFLMGRGM